MLRRLAPSVALVLLLGCAGGEAVAPPRLPEVASPVIDLAAIRGEKRAQAFAWLGLDATTWQRAKRENKPILLHGAAEWCHFCHVMEAVTYTDPAVAALINASFLPVRVDIDARPDIAERYGEWGWPATIVLSPDGRELGKYRGYVPPEAFREALAGALQSLQNKGGEGTRLDPVDVGAVPSALPWIAASLMHELDDYYDTQLGGWGRRQKAPLGANISFEVIRSQRGDPDALPRALFSVEKQRALIDPVWGGIYQYAVGGTWNEPHYEKLMTYQAANIEAYARVYRVTKRADHRRDLDALVGYVGRFLTNAEGAFLPTQDADVGAHDANAKFVDGHTFYAANDADRRRMGIPRIDPHVYAYENGLAIAAFVAAWEATGDPDTLARAKRAADLLLGTHVGPDGSVSHEARAAETSAQTPRFLVDYAALGRALARLSKASEEERYGAAAATIASAMNRDFSDHPSRAFFSSTIDPNAQGALAERSRALVPNTLAARFAASLFAIDGDKTALIAARTRLADALTPRAAAEQGRMLGELLLGLDELGVGPWPSPGP